MMNPHTTTEPLSLVSIRCKKEMAEEQDIPYMNLQHPFQRSYEAWTMERRTELIESIMMGRDINPIWIVQTENDGEEVVLDGMHRLTTLLQFMDNKTTLGEIACSELHHLSGKKFSDFDGDEKAKFRNYNITINRLDSSYSRDPSRLMEMWELSQR